MTYEVEMNAALDAVRRASSVCQRVQRGLVTPETLEKKDKSPVTVADFASQAVVCAVLQNALPDDEVVGEEAADELRTGDQSALRSLVHQNACEGLGVDASEADVLAWIDRGGSAGSGSRYWTLDPIDGTKGFLRGEQYAVALALLEDGKVVLGVLGCPNLESANGAGVLIASIRGQGARMLSTESGSFADGTPISVGAISDPAAARFCESVESGHSDQDQSVMIAKQLGITAEPVRMDSQCKYAAVARGDAQIYLRLPTRKDYREKIWDHAAGLIAVEEAGGTVTDVTGKPLDFSHGRQLEQNAGVVATGGSIHDAVVAAVRDVLGV